jgi:hypothetical protein
LVLDELRSHIFKVKLARTDTVNALKEAIKDKKKHAFQHVDAGALVLWRVFIPKNEKSRLVNDKIVVPLKRLAPLCMDQSADDHIHIAVKRPPVGELDWFIARSSDQPLVDLPLPCFAPSDVSRSDEVLTRKWRRPRR